MNDSQKPQLAAGLAKVLAAYGKPLPQGTLLNAWFDELAPYSLPTIQAAFQSYRDENGEFPPVPAGIAKRCKLMDGRPGPEEAWAIALTSLDEADTVVWTEECAAAFAIARPVLDSSGAISARKPFLEAYERLVGRARAAHRPAVWITSTGWDATRVQPALTCAVSAGLLAAPDVSRLAGPAADETPDDKAREQLAAVRKMLADGEAARRKKLDDEFDARNQAEAAERARINADIAAKVAAHNQGNP